MPTKGDDIVEIQNVLAIYPVALDTHNLGLFELCFTGDARIDVGNPGVETAAEWAAYLKARLSVYSVTQHLLGLPVIQVDGDRARSLCYVPCAR